MLLFSMMLLALAPTDATPFAAREGDAVPMQPAINPGRWVTNDDYPPEAMREEREGTTGFRITIDAKGLPTDCEIMSSSGHADLDAATCRLVVERARFTPGRDAAGRATGGTYSNRIRWQIPDDHDHPAFMPADFAAMLPRIPVPDASMFALDPADHYPASARAEAREGTVTMLLDISASGAVTGCKVDEGSGHADLDGAACDLMRQHGKFSAALDAAGNPGAGRYSGRFTWSLPVEPEPADAESDEIAGALADLPGRRPKLGDMVPAASNLVLEVNADGTIKRCQFDATAADKTKEAPASPCAMFESLAPFAPILDDRGEAIGQRFEIRSTLSPQAPTAAP